MDSKPYSEVQVEINPLSEPYEEQAEVVTQLSLESIEKTELKSIKKQLYRLVESANNLGMRIGVRNIDIIKNDDTTCYHLMESCQRKDAKFSDLYMILKSIYTSTSGNQTHWIELTE